MSSGSSTTKLLSVLVTVLLPFLTQAVQFGSELPVGPGWEDDGAIREPFINYLESIEAGDRANALDKMNPEGHFQGRCEGQHRRGSFLSLGESFTDFKKPYNAEALLEMFLPVNNPPPDVRIERVETFTRDLNNFVARVAFWYEDHKVEYELLMKVKDRKIQYIFIDQRHVLRWRTEGSKPSSWIDKLYKGLQKVLASFNAGRS